MIDPPGSSARVARSWPVVVVSGMTASVVVGAVALTLILASPIGRPSIAIEVSSPRAGYSQMFYADEPGAFSERDSVRQRVDAGENWLHFPISAVRETVGTHQRWDPLETSASMLVRSFTVRSALAEWTPPEGFLRPSVDVAEIRSSPEGLVLETQSHDGQALMDLDLTGFQQRNLAAAALIAGVVGLAFGALTAAFARQAEVPPVGRLVPIAGATLLAVLGAVLLGWVLVLR